MSKPKPLPEIALCKTCLSSTARVSDKDKLYRVVCYRCNTLGHQRQTKFGAIKAWNREQAKP